MKIIPSLLCVSLFSLSFCTPKSDKESKSGSFSSDSVKEKQIIADAVPKTIKIEIKKELLFDKHTLADTYPYKDTTRAFQWDKIREQLKSLEAIRNEQSDWGILQNYKNKNGEAPLVKKYRRDAYKRIADTLGVERFQSVPLYSLVDSTVPELYGKDGELVRLIKENGRFYQLETINPHEEWLVPKKYVKAIADTVDFRKAIFVDRTNQNIATMEKSDSEWLVRSMNPATTGMHKPPYAQETPLGLFVVQEKKSKMIFLVDGTTETGGFAPYASRFTNGGYIHGVPVNAPRTALIDFSPSLGTTPRSHMCVRNATSHAKFVYDWAPLEETLVFVFD